LVFDQFDPNFAALPLGGRLGSGFGSLFRAGIEGFAFRAHGTSTDFKKEEWIMV
jgi:hypothetical protein